MTVTKKPKLLIAGVAITMLWWSGSAHAGDWPQFRYGAGRCAASPDQLSAQLHLQWVRECLTPHPAFPTELRLRYDASYEPVVLGKRMFVPSMVTDSVAALDVDTGAQAWRFFAGGPVRFAPVAWQGKVYFASDDGYLYCLDAASGQLQWRFRGLPSGRKDRKLLGNKRLISLYPARGGPVLADGIVYFAAGIWPSAGVFVHALDAQTGRVLWSNTDSHHIAKANLDHGVQSPAGLTPQGYLAVVGEKLIVPCGAQLPGLLDRKTGELRSYTTGWGGRIGLPKGSWFVAAAGNHLIHSGDLYALGRPNDEEFANHDHPNFKPLLYVGGRTRLQIDPTCHKDLGRFRKPVLASNVMYCNAHDGKIAAYDLANLKMEIRKKSDAPSYRRDDHYPDKWRAALPERWRADSKLQVHIKAGSRLYAGGPGVVKAIDIPGEAGEPKTSWHAEIDGMPHRMLAADGKLFVVTLQGRIYAFGEKSDSAAAVHAAPNPVPPTKDDPWTKTAARMLKETKISEGYALVLGIGSGRLAEELIRQSQLRVVMVDPDPQKVAALRRRLYQAGVYGTRISVHVGDPLTYPFPPYLASLIVSEDIASAMDSPDDRTVQRICHPLRPYGGTVCLRMAAARGTALAKKLSERNLPGVVTRQTEDLLLLTRRGPLPGAADWSHEEADAANTGASEDELARAPLELLWFDGSFRWNRQPGNVIVRVAGGRVLVVAGTLRAIDVYTGRPLWEVPMPRSARPPALGDMVAVDDAIYVTSNRTCLVLDPATGQQVREIEIPADPESRIRGNWSKIRVSGNHLVGIIGAHVVCFDIGSGALRWSSPAPPNRRSLAVGGGRVFCSGLPRRPNQGGARGANEKARTFALDLTTGKLLWETSQAGRLRYSVKHDLLVTPNGVYQAADGKRLRDSHAAWGVSGDRMFCGEDPQYIEFYHLLTGARIGDPLQWFRRGCTGLRASRHLVTTRLGGNAAYVDLATRKITPIRAVRSGCQNNLFPANGVLNVPNLTGGCTCNYTPTSLALVPCGVRP